jgi:hypothetical protein
MPLKLRPTGLGSRIDKDRADYTVFCGEWNIGRIYEVRRTIMQGAVRSMASGHQHFLLAGLFSLKWSIRYRRRSCRDLGSTCLHTP